MKNYLKLRGGAAATGTIRPYKQTMMNTKSFNKRAQNTLVILETFIMNNRCELLNKKKITTIMII